MGQQLRTLSALFQGTWFQFPGPTWQLKQSISAVLGESNTLTKHQST